MRRRQARTSLICIIKLAIAALAVYFVFLRSNPRTQSLLAIDSALDLVLLDYAISEDSLDTKFNAIFKVQQSLACYIQQGTWKMESHPTVIQRPSYPRSSKASQFQSFVPNYSCLGTNPSDHTVDVCPLLSAKKVLLVGPETTYYLHTLWLSALQFHENRPFDCLGPEFCTFHHICQPPYKGPDEEFQEERVKKVPRDQDLAESGSAVLRYVLSTSLHPTSNPQDIAYTVPVVDKFTGVRKKNAYWLAHARRADVVVLNRGPVPPPASTYGPPGNWSFINDPGASLELPTFQSIIDAALHVTIVNWLPEVMKTLRVLESDVGIGSTLVWHSSWYIPPWCANPSIPKVPYSTPDTLLKGRSDPWTLYYNAQGRSYPTDIFLSSSHTLIPSLHAQQPPTPPPSSLWRYFPASRCSYSTAGYWPQPLQSKRLPAIRPWDTGCFCNAGCIFRRPR